MDLRSAAGRIDAATARRLDEVVTEVMRREDIDCWVVAGREYDEDPVLRTMLPATWLSARRRTIVVFLDRGGERVDRMAISRYAIGSLFPAAWDPEREPDQWRRLAELLEEADPRTIAVDRSESFAHADGLSATEYQAMVAALPAGLRARLVPAERVAVGWLETRLPDEVETMAEACRVAHGFLARALSREVVDPGRTTTGDVEWWLRQTVHDDGLGTWFHPTVRVQRRTRGAGSFASRPDDTTIERGDLVHIDFGIEVDRLCTDQQQHGYVLDDGESDAPGGLAAGMAVANRLQDLLMAEFVTGRTGNEILAATRTAAAAEGITGRIYTHPIGLHGHGAGPTIGLWDRQDGVPGAGDAPLHPHTAFSIELLAEVAVPEWGGSAVWFMLEEEAIFDGDACRFLDGRQTRLHLI